MFAKQKVVLVATCRNPGAATQLQAILRESGQPEAESLDTTDQASVTALVNKIQQKYKKVDILINNAVIATMNHPHDPPDQLDTQEMIKIFSTNVGGTCLVTKAFLPILKLPKTRDASVFRPSWEVSQRTNHPSPTST